MKTESLPGTLIPAGNLKNVLNAVCTSPPGRDTKEVGHRGQPKKFLQWNGEKFTAKVVKFLDLQKRTMRKKIYYGEVIITDLQSQEHMIIPEMIYTEGDRLTDENIINGILRRKRGLKRDGFRVVRLCYDTAKQVGETVE